MVLDERRRPEKRMKEFLALFFVPAEGLKRKAGIQCRSARIRSWRDCLSLHV